MNTESQEPLLVVKEVISGNSHYNLYFCRKEMYIIHIVKGRPAWGLGLFGVGLLLSYSIEKYREKRYNNKTSGLSLDEIVARDKSSFRIPYDEISKIEIHPVYIKIKTRKRQFEFAGLEKYQSQSLFNLLMSLPSVAGKVTG